MRAKGCLQNWTSTEKCDENFHIYSLEHPMDSVLGFILGNG